MAYNKTKHVENAQRFLHQGKVALAIGEYQIILKQEPKDQVTLMTVGDLFVRQGDTFQALEYFERLAQIFLSDGFITKAIAVYKKIAKLAPEETRPLERLGELYIQQGVLSEARPIYLHLAELHQRAGRQPQAIALLRKLLEAEPDNLRLQTRLAELSLAANQPGDAKAAYLAAAEQLHRHGDHDEAVKYADRALKIDPSDAAGITLKARAMAAAGKRNNAVILLEGLPQLEASGEAAQLLIDLYLEANDTGRACELAAKFFARDAKNFAPAHRVATQLLESGGTDRALTLLDMVREAMTDAGEHEALSQSLIRVAEKLPSNIESREWLVELYARTSDSFRLPDALAALAEACEAAGKHDRARQVYEELLERNPENEAARQKYARVGKTPQAFNPPPAAPVPAQTAPAEAPRVSAPAEKLDTKIDDETQQFVAQALTDVDLFSSYGLTQKAIDLLEIVLQRAPNHTATLERLCDLYLGAGDELRTAELASQLQRIHSEGGDTAAADRFAELSRRFQRAAALTPEVSPAARTASPPEFSMPGVGPESTSVAEATLEPVLAMGSATTQDSPAELASEAAGMKEGASADPVHEEVHEVDLSDEWAALSEEIVHATPPTAESQNAATIPEMEVASSTVESETVAAPGEAPVDPLLDISEFQALAEANVEANASSEAAAVASRETAPAEMPEIALQPSSDAQPEYVLELEPTSPARAPSAPVLNAEDFLQSLSAELDPEPVAGAISGIPASRAATPGAPMEMTEVAITPHKPPSNGNAGPLADVFDEFRADMAEGAGDEDLETHYNLGVAYREMGLVEEAISEFQKVAKSASNGQDFRYAMQCYTLLGLAFMEKGEPSIAAMWYQRALQTVGLDQETILALRYDLGVAQEMAGDLLAARKSFSEVYGTNIDYRDVAERLASLGKG